MGTDMTNMGTLTEISDYPWRWRRDYLMLVAAVAISDEDLHPDE